MKLRHLIGAAVIAAALPAAAQAVVLGTLNITGDREPGAIFTPTGHVDFAGFGSASSATGIFEPVVTISESAGGGGPFTVFSLFDIEFETTPHTIYSGDGFSFTATSFHDFDNDPSDMTLGFAANGTVTTPTGVLPGFFMFSTQPDAGNVQISFSSTTQVIPLPASVLMLLAGLGGLGIVSRRKTATA